MKAPENPVPFIITAIVSIIVTVLALDFYGYIRHSNIDDTRQTDSFRAVLLEAGEQYRMSHKTSDKVARCVQGFLALEFSHNGKPAGFLIDNQNRGVPCAMSQ